MGTRFRALAAPVDASTGDRRRFAEGALSTQPLPMPGRWQREDAGGHDYAVSVASLDTVDIQGPDVWVEGEWFDDIDPMEMPRLAEDVKEAMYLAEKGVLGFSVDLDDFDGTIVQVGTSNEVTEADLENPDLEMETLVTKGRMRAATLVAIPAFVETNHTIQLLDPVEPKEEIAPTEPTDAMPLLASVSGATDLPVTDERDHAWDGPAAAGRVLDDAEDADGNIDKASAGRAFLWVDGDGTKRGDYKLGFADIVDGELKIVPRGVAATAGGRGVDSTDGVDREAVKSRICSLYATVRGKFDDWPECPFDSGSKASAITAAQRYALVASQMVTPDAYPLEAFSPPVAIDGPTPITFDWEADPPRAYGHIYQHGTCHVGFKAECRTPPVDEDFSRFHVHPVETTMGTVFVGRLTAGGFHADDAGSLADVQREHDAKTTVAYVQAKVDDYGIFACGPLLEVDEPTREILDRRKVSGHWPVVGDDGQLALAEILALPAGPPSQSEPGFPVHRMHMHFRAGRFAGITAALGPEAPYANRVPDYAAIFRTAYAVISEEQAREAQAARDAGAARAELAATMGIDTEMMRAELAAAVGE